MKNGKKLFCLLLALLLAVSLAPAAFAADVLSFSRVSVIMPEITAELKGLGYEAGSISAKLGTETLTVADAHDYNRMNDSTLTYILVDLSGSMAPSFGKVKQNIETFVDAMGPNDQVILITFGEKEVKTLLTGGESAETIKETVNALKANEEGTLFYEALMQTYQKATSGAASGFDREFMLIFSDGTDEQKGSTTYQEVADLYKTHLLPMYAVCPYGASKSATDRFGELARGSGGSLTLINHTADFDLLMGEIENITMLKLRAATNIADGQNRLLSVQIGDSRVECNVPVSRSIPDTEAPTVSALYYDEEEKVIVVGFSEAVDGALSAGSYRVRLDGENLEVAGVTAGDAENTYELRVRGLKNGTATLSFPGIKDRSQQANPVAGERELELENVPKEGGLPLWAIIAIAGGAVLLIGLAVLFASLSAKKRKKAEAENAAAMQDAANQAAAAAGAAANAASAANAAAESASAAAQAKERAPGVVEYGGANAVDTRHHVLASGAVRVRLRIKTGRTAEQTVEATVVSSLIVGRSDTCDVYVDDNKLSRQHFVVENDNGRFFVTDLQSRNGTFLNGTRVTSRQLLNSGDKIVAGMTDFVITF